MREFNFEKDFTHDKLTSLGFEKKNDDLYLLSCDKGTIQLYTNDGLVYIGGNEFKLFGNLFKLNVPSFFRLKQIIDALGIEHEF